MKSQKHQRRIGILGGTFDPVHIGHLILAQEAMVKLKLDRVIFIPTYLPPHKKGCYAKAEHRYKMLLLAVRKMPNFKISRMEIEAKGLSYSIYTVHQLRQIYKNAELYFIIGSDLVCELKKWKHIDRLLKICKFVVAKRGEHLPKEFFADMKIIDIPQIGISSSDIRRRIKRGEPVGYLLPDAVFDYIKRHRLYVNTR